MLSPDSGVSNWPKLMQTVEISSPPTKADTSLENIEKLEGLLLLEDQRNIPLRHSFAPGVYLREVDMPKDTFVIGHKHKTRHFNIVLSGKASVLMNGVVHQIEAPSIFVSDPGVRKVLYIREDMRWATVHPTNETDIEMLELELVEKSEAFKLHDLECRLLIESNNPTGGDQ